jgi:uncharacterized protein involved in exopolysaccharide biosynthesis
MRRTQIWKSEAAINILGNAMGEQDSNEGSVRLGSATGEPHQIPVGYFVQMDEPTANDGADIFEWIKALLGYRKLIVLVAIASAIIAVASSLLMTPMYRAEIVLAPADAGSEPRGLQGLMGQFGGLADMAGISMPASGGLEIALVTLQSRQFIGRFVDDVQAKPVLFDGRWDQDSATWKVPSDSVLSKLSGFLTPRTSQPVGPDFAIGEPTLLETHRLFTQEVMRVTKNGDVGVVTVLVEWKDPQVAARWANELIDLLNAEIRQGVIEESERSIEYLRGQIERTSLAELQEVMYRLIEEHTKNISLAKASDDYALKVIDPAIVPDKSFKPNRLLMMILGFIGGAMLAILFAFAKEAMRAEN